MASIVKQVSKKVICIVLNVWLESGCYTSYFIFQCNKFKNSRKRPNGQEDRTARWYMVPHCILQVPASLWCVVSCHVGVWSRASAEIRVGALQMYRVVQKRIPSFILGDNFGNSAPILTILSLLQAEIYGA